MTTLSLAAHADEAANRQTSATLARINRNMKGAFKS